MVWTYHQSTGKLEHNGALVATGYSGAEPDGKNQAKMEMVRNVGPIPRGKYEIGKPYQSADKGPQVLPLTPVGHNALGRTDFRIHGDSVKHPGKASEGCIIVGRKVRDKIAMSGDNVLEVVMGIHVAKDAVERKSAHEWSMSDKGFDFLYEIEALANVSSHVHIPPGGSGVTLGPGYDMRERTKGEIKKHMLKLGLGEKIADAVAEAAGLHGKAAKKFVLENKKIVQLTRKQEFELMRIAVRPKEKILRKWLEAKVSQYEYDAMVSFTYNPGASIVPVTKLINEGKTAAAMDLIKTRVMSGGQSLNGLVNRRAKEVELYTTGAYTQIQTVDAKAKAKAK